MPSAEHYMYVLNVYTMPHIVKLVQVLLLSTFPYSLCFNQFEMVQFALALVHKYSPTYFIMEIIMVLITSNATIVQLM